MATTPIRQSIEFIGRNGIGEVSRLGLGHKDVIPLWFGESDLVTPDFIRNAAKQALDEGQTFYTFSAGHPRLRQAIVDWTKRHYGLALDIDRVTVPGAAMLAVITALQCVVETGDEIIIISPVWPNIFFAVQAVGGKPVFVRLERAHGGGNWSLNFDALARAVTPRTKAIFCASPGNPTGWVASADEQRKLLAFARERGLAILADEVYGQLVYDAPNAPSFLSIAEPDDNVFVINSFSKAWAMTGWRIGWLVGPKRLARPLMQLSTLNNTGATTFAQFGAIAALEHGDDFVREMVQRCARGREIMDQFVRSQNRVTWSKPEGAFYAFIEVDGMKDSLSFAKALVEKARVGVAPGSAFGPETDRENDRYLRLCFAISPDKLETALGRIGDALKTL